MPRISSETKNVLTQLFDLIEELVACEQIAGNADQDKMKSCETLAGKLKEHSVNAQTLINFLDRRRIELANEKGLLKQLIKEN